MVVILGLIIRRPTKYHLQYYRDIHEGIIHKVSARHTETSHAKGKTNCLYLGQKRWITIYYVLEEPTLLRSVFVRKRLRGHDEYVRSRYDREDWSLFSILLRKSNQLVCHLHMNSEGGRHCGQGRICFFSWRVQELFWKFLKKM